MGFKLRPDPTDRAILHIPCHSGNEHQKTLKLRKRHRTPSKNLINQGSVSCHLSYYMEIKRRMSTKQEWLLRGYNTNKWFHSGPGVPEGVTQFLPWTDQLSIRWKPYLERRRDPLAAKRVCLWLNSIQQLSWIALFYLLSWTGCWNIRCSEERT